MVGNTGTCLRKGSRPMMKIKESIVPGWSEEPEGYVYPPALEGTAFKPWGLDPMCVSALDMLDWAGFDCLV